ncbi:hypothetical protein [Gelatiniphilus marinus]|uniref:TPM domain-containing protein n=1 Tax=Gelatiniphilus marinus TaxID=1759464 RepID=A0ABW5JTC4_9FLAO
MPKQSISMFFTVIFLLYITAPAIVVMVDNASDASVVISTSEEKDQGLELVFSNTATIQTKTVFNYAKNILAYNLKKYPKPYLILISQPPEQIYLG